MNDRYTPTFNIHEAVRKTLPYMMEMREYFHAHPELSEKEFDTCKTIFQELSLMGIEDVKIIAGTGVTGLIHGALPGPVILLRADIDALPLTEKFDCPYSSLVDGVMHACGHDGHAANLLGVAKILNKHKDCLRGTIRLAFQPAERLCRHRPRRNLGLLRRLHDHPPRPRRPWFPAVPVHQPDPDGHRHHPIRPELRLQLPR